VKIGPYTVLGTLGQGGTGAVFRVLSPGGEEVALKLLGKTTPAALARFRREERLLGSFTARDGFVPLLDAGGSDDGPYLVMPLLGGGTLRERLADGPLGVEEALGLGRALARALGHAHARGVVHRDLKPENVLFAEGGTARGAPLIADLGLAKHFGAGDAGVVPSVALTRSGEIKGTFGYMPLEQMKSFKEADARADVFALGAILYEALAGRPAFMGASVAELFRAIESGAVESLGALRPETPAWLERVVLRALAREPEGRFRDGLELARALEGPASLRLGSRARAAAPAALLGLVLLALPLVARLAGLGMPSAGETLPAAGSGGADPRAGPAAGERGPNPGWLLEPGRTVGARLEVDTRNEYPGKMTYVDSETFDLRLVAEPEQLGRALVHVRIEAVRIHCATERVPGVKLPPEIEDLLETLDYDSRKEEGLDASPFHEAIGKSFAFNLDASTGLVSGTSGVGAIGRAIVASVGDERQAVRYDSALDSETGIEGPINELLHLLPPGVPPGRTWRLERHAVSHDEKGELPRALLATFKRGEPDGTGNVEVRWSGTAERENLVHKVRGSATFGTGRLLRSHEVNELEEKILTSRTTLEWNETSH
jgi:hypothetical protein